MAKGKYFGPDKNKGIRPTGKDKYYGPNKYKGVAPGKKSSGGGGKISGSLINQARQLGKGKYAGALKELEMNEGTNTDLYNNAATQRRAAIDRELGSIQAAGATAGRKIGDLGASNASMYQQTIANSQSNTQALMDKVNTNNSSMLSSLQQSMKERGVENVADYSNVQGKLGEKNELLAAMGNLQRNSLESQSGLADQRFKAMQGGVAQLDLTAQSTAKGAAQANFDELYTKWLDRQKEIDTAQAKTELEKGDYINQTYMTLKEQAAAKKAAAAQAALQARIASGNLAYKNTALQVGTQYKYDKLASDVAQKGIENKFKERGFSATQAEKNARLIIAQSGNTLAWEKFNWSKANPKKSASVTIADLLASGN